MSRRPVAFRQADLKRALAAAKAAGVDIKVEFDPATGKISVTTLSGEANVEESLLDKWLAERARAS
jgi:hypothetical protein